jgi:hypothetical protein
VVNEGIAALFAACRRKDSRKEVGFPMNIPPILSKSQSTIQGSVNFLVSPDREQQNGLSPLVFNKHE